MTRVSHRQVRATCGTLTHVTNPGQTFTVTTAAEACRVSRKTITRRLPQLREGGAYKDEAGAWVIPLNALLHAKFTPGRPASPDGANGREDDAEARGDMGWYSREEIAELRSRAAVAEALAAARAEQITDLRRAVAALEAAKGDRREDAPPPVAAVPASTVPVSVPPSAPKRGLLGRLVDNLGL